MPDTPDFYEYLPGSDRYSLSDMGELAVRLGSLSTYDRRGEVIWQDRIEKGLAPYVITSYGTGGGYRIVTNHVTLGSYALEMIAGTDTGSLSWLVKYFAAAALYRIGIEVSLSFPVDCQYVYLWLSRFTGTKRYTARLAIYPTTGDIKITDKTGAIITLGTIGGMVSVYGMYHFAKLVADFNTNKYVRVLVDHYEYKLTAYDLIETTDTGNPQSRVELILGGRAGYNDNIELGHMILTSNEP